MQKKISLMMTLLSIFLFSCINTNKENQGSKINSLTEEELESCVFKGKRYFVMVSPFFEADVPAMQDLFVKFHSDNQFMKASYIQEHLKGNPNCQNYYESHASRYEEFVVIQGSNATYTEYAKRLVNLRNAIINGYIKQTAPEDRGPVQIILSFNSHGNVKIPTIPDGSVLFNDTEVNSQVVAQSIYENLLTKCNIMDQNCETPNEQIADEIIITMDTCFAGNFSEQFGNLLENKGYPSNIDDSRSKATKTMIITSSNTNQIAAGTLEGSGGYGRSSQVGTIAHTLSEIFNYHNADHPSVGNNDGKVTMNEVFNYFTETSFNRFAGRAISAIKQQAQNGICAFDRPSMMGHKALYNNNRSFFQRFYENPLEEIYNNNNGMEAYSRDVMVFTIQRPTIYSNMSSKLLEETVLSIGVKGTNHSSQVDHQMDILISRELRKEYENEIMMLALIHSKIDQYLQNRNFRNQGDEMITPLSANDLGIDSSYEELFQYFQSNFSECDMHIPYGNEPGYEPSGNSGEY